MFRLYQGIFLRLVISVLTLVFSLCKTNAQLDAGTHVTSDPALGSFGIYDLAGNLVDGNTLHQNSYYLIKLQIYNFDQGSPIPAGTAKVIVNLGTSFILDPAFDLSSETTLLENFTLGLEQQPEDQIYGIIHTDLPEDYSGILTIRVKANVQGTSTVTENFVISNNNPLFVLSDSHSNNNSAFITYSILAPIPLPVTITKFNVVNNNCNILVKWVSENEQNLARYEVEASKDGINYSKQSSVAAAARSNYNTSFPISNQLKTGTLMVRLKTVDLDGSYKYSEVVNVPGHCGPATQSLYYAYPNPLTNWDNLTISKRSGLFKGVYYLRLIDHVGRLCDVKTVELNNVTSFRPELLNDTRGTGKYLLEIRKTDGTETGVINIERL